MGGVNRTEGIYLQNAHVLTDDRKVGFKIQQMSKLFSHGGAALAPYFAITTV